jgi:hypothetical protein
MWTTCCLSAYIEWCQILGTWDRADQLFQLTTLIVARTLHKQQHGTFSNFKGVFVPSSYLLPFTNWLTYQWMNLVGLLVVFRGGSTDGVKWAIAPPQFLKYSYIYIDNKL